MTLKRIFFIGAAILFGVAALGSGSAWIIPAGLLCLAVGLAAD